MGFKNVTTRCADFATCDFVDGNVLHWGVDLTGPAGSAYEGLGVHFDLVFPADYPFKPPAVLASAEGVLLASVFHAAVDGGDQVNPRGPILRFAVEPRSPSAARQRRRCFCGPMQRCYGMNGVAQHAEHHHFEWLHNGRTLFMLPLVLN